MDKTVETTTEKPKKDNLKWWILLTVIVGTFLGRLDQTIVNLALPNIISDFSISISAAGWIATAYILANAIFVPIWGKLGDTIGRKKVYIIGFGIFIVGSVLAGFAWNLPSMIVFRVIQAIAGSADYPTAMAILAVTFKEGKERAQALGIWSSSFAAASVFGPLLGGPLIDTFGWRSVFLINLPVGIVGLLMAMRFINESRSEVKSKFFDWWGALSLGGMLSALVLVLDKGAEWGWLSASSTICYFLVVVLTGLFIRIEQRVPEPIVDLRFFKIPAFVNTLLNNFVVFMGLMGGLFLLPVFAQTFLGYNATQTGYLFMPMAAALMIGAPVGGALTGKVPTRYVIFASTVVAAIGLYMFSFLDPKSTALSLMLPLCVMAFGLGFGMAQRTNVIASVVDQSEIGVASSILALARNVAGAFGIAIFGTILTNRTKFNIMQINSFSHLYDTSAINMQKFVTLVELKAQINAYNYVFVVASVIVGLGAIAALWLKVKNERTDIVVHVE
ncbi:MAG: transporter, family, tetracycline resistance protein [Candidatus Nomurabacteria bacterium]|nr:transporter, family, tetracycline resistance protein [Candidatus Nomurabacteria bacterium]